MLSTTNLEINELKAPITSSTADMRTEGSCIRCTIWPVI
jgi:hypothetical protein